MTWDTDWSTAVGEVITEIQTIASNQATDEANIASLQSAVGVVASSSSSSLPSLATALVQNRFLKLYAVGQTNGGTSISISVNGSVVLNFPASFSGGSNQFFMLEATLWWDGSRLYIAPVSPWDNNARMQTPNLGGLSSLTFSIDGTSSVSSFVLKPA